MTIGYIVQCDSAMLLHTDGLLYFGNYATVFTTRRHAQRAIERTLYDRPTFEKEFGRLSIKRLEPES